MSSSSETLFALSTQVEPAGAFEVDGESYILRSLDSLSQDEEARLMALFNKAERLGKKMDAARDQREAERSAGLIRECRIDIIVATTDLPATVAASLGITSQNRLLAEVTKMLKTDDPEVSD